MSVLNDTWGYLVQRKLWPLAVLLVAALVAVPLLLAKDPVPAAPAPVADTKASQSQLATEPIVALAGPGDRAGRRRVLGSRKNPFQPARLPKKAKAPKTTVVVPAATTPATAPDPGTGGGGSTPVSGVTPVTPGSTTPKKTYERFELSVRFGPSTDTGELPKSDVKRLEALPSAEEPVLVYLGVLSDKKTAVFLVDAGVVAQGDGKCMPSRTSCETIHLKAGETEFFDVVGDDKDAASAQFQLDLVTIRRTTTTSAKAAKRSYARVSKAGKKIVRARVAGDGPLRFRYSEKTGRLHKLTTKAYKAAVARSARAARAHF